MNVSLPRPAFVDRGKGEAKFEVVPLFEFGDRGHGRGVQPDPVDEVRVQALRGNGVDVRAIDIGPFTLQCSASSPRGGAGHVLKLGERDKNRVTGRRHRGVSLVTLRVRGLSESSTSGIGTR